MADVSKLALMKTKYYESIREMSKNKPQKELMTCQWVQVMVQRIQSAKEIMSNEGISELPSVGRDALENYDVVSINHQDTFVKKSKDEPGSYRQIIALERSFDIVLKAHLNTLHGGVTAMQQWLSNFSYYVAKICLPALISVCQKCLLGIELEEPEIAVKNKYTNIALIGFANMSLVTDKSYQYLLIYQDFWTKFVQLRPITEVDDYEISMELIKLFNDFPLPQCVLVETKMFHFFECVLGRLNGTFLSEISLETSDDNRKVMVDIGNKVMEWIADTECNTWTVGCHYVQWEMNSIRNYDGSPYEKFFGLKKFAMDDSQEEPYKSVERVKRSVEHAKPTVEHAKRSVEHAKPTVEHAKRSVEHAEPTVEHAKRSVEHVKQTVEHAKQSVEHAKPTVEHAKRSVEHVKKTVEHAKQSVEHAKLSEETITVSDSDSDDQSNRNTVSARLEPEAVVVDENETFRCCTCNAEMKNLVYTCCVCKRTLHLYCGLRRQTANDIVETICYTCMQV